VRRTAGKSEGRERERQRENKVGKRPGKGFFHSPFPPSSLTLPFVFP
jgi:hypothetical protein